MRERALGGRRRVVKESATKGSSPGSSKTTHVLREMSESEDEYEYDSYDEEDDVDMVSGGGGRSSYDKVCINYQPAPLENPDFCIFLSIRC